MNRMLTGLKKPERVETLKKKMLDEKRYVSIEQARIITDTYKRHSERSAIVKRALSLKNALLHLSIDTHNEELIVGNRSRGVRQGIIFPESGTSWIDREFESLPTRPQDKFQVRQEDIEVFRQDIRPYWKSRSLEDVIRERYGGEIDEIALVVKINQKDHAQGHICPNTEKWLKLGPEGIKQEASARLAVCEGESREFYESVILVMEGAQEFMLRYHRLILEKLESESDPAIRQDMRVTADNCRNLSRRPAESFHEAVQSLWFLFAILHLESNASSFSPGRMDQYLYPYFKKDLDNGTIDEQRALEIIECLWLKFNQIVYLRNSHSAKFFAGFPIGFNIAVGGQTPDGKDATNELSFLLLKAQEHLLLPQPNLSVRLHKNTPEELLKESIRVVSLGSGMPQFFNDESVIPAMTRLGISQEDANNYAIVGCVELTTPGNNLGWSDAAMFNLNKVLELTLNNGRCLITGKALAPDLGNIETYESFEQLEAAFAKQIHYFIDKMIAACEVVEKAHIDILPSPFLSSVIDNCVELGKDVTAAGAKYNFSGIQMIQIANLADSLAAIKKLVFDEKRISSGELLEALRANFEGHEVTRAMLLNRAPKYGNDIVWVDELGAKWARTFNKCLSQYRNYRGGLYHTGMYTVSAHIPMGENVGASPDGRYSREPLADGGMSPVYGRDMNGPTAVLNSVSRLDNHLTSNGGLLNMKFLPEFFKTESGINKFSQFMRTFVDLEIPHIQFNVLKKEDLIAAKESPEDYRGLTVRVAGYTAYFTELADELQNEIIARTSYGEI
ncbi:formate C-acetyltransferase [Paenibacillus sophorae]|uniref:Formate C-acetyltransferase n=1 Tax=Paenibacillus sophorae TaxID=1333845 RepID=A0A1H8F902_9BACL|nr:formate C-acetyltransferase/glycerol dehydratase family glycyl radical enzyme [Paenibacillus sophorae]QWU13796.1 formate C-acetyltransferase/glycerol dehydratase family glycyl radical enzyme [Paenibacillus sophorae]SEN28025.1 formate C-acetyltransferase [Paenibacillus sophorae]